MYERTRSITEVTLQRQAPRTPRDKVQALFNDGKYHSAYELQYYPDILEGEWYVALRELIDFGYAFGRRGNSFVIRKRSVVEKPQDLAELLSGIDATRPEDVNHMYDQAKNPEQVQVPAYEMPSVEGEPGEDTGAEYSMIDTRELLGTDDVGDASGIAPSLPDGGENLIISVDPRGCVIPVKGSIMATRAILAMKESGKTYLAMVIAEEFRRAKTRMPFVVIDPTGVWYGLNAMANGTPSANPVIVIGGTHGQFELSPNQGKVVAEMIVSMWPNYFVLDISDMLPEDQHRFVADFGNVIYTINKKALHIFIDEADEFAPQRLDGAYPDQKRCLGVIDRIIRRGRVKGLGGTLLTQRAAVINKNVLSQVDGLFVMKMMAPNDLETIEEWMKSVVSMSQRTECRIAIPKFSRGEAFFVRSGPTPLVKFMTRKKVTFDSSKSPTPEEPEPPVPSLAAPDRETLLAVAEGLGLPPPSADEVGGES